MGGWPQLRETRTVRSGQASGAVIRCGLRDALLSSIPASIVHFYDVHLPADKLADGLAQALATVPIFGGRLRTDGDVMDIVCSDEGVPMEFFTVEETLDEAIGRVAPPSSGLASHVEARQARDGSLPLLTVRVTELTDGTALGVSFHHTLGDLQTYLLLMQAWSAAVDGLPAPEVIDVPDRDAHLDAVVPPGEPGLPTFRVPTPEMAEILEAEVQVSARANRTVQIYFGADEVDRMKEQFGAEAGRRLSTNDVLAAHVHTSLRDVDADYTGERPISMGMNVRPRLGLPSGMTGNLVGDVYLKCAPDTSPAKFAAQIRETLEALGAGHPTFRADRRVIEEVGRDRLAECVPYAFDPPHRTLALANWTRFGLADVAFGGRKPVLVCPTTAVSLPWVGWMVEGFEGVGILLTLVVPVRFAGKLRGADGKARLHRYRADDDVLPALATAGRVI